MIAIPSLLAEVARASGINVPEDLDNYEREDFPHWHVYQGVQLGAPMPHPSAHHDNAKVIAQLSDSKIRTVTFEELERLGIAR